MCFLFVLYKVNRVTTGMPTEASILTWKVNLNLKIQHGRHACKGHNCRNELFYCSSKVLCLVKSLAYSKTSPR